MVALSTLTSLRRLALAAQHDRITGIRKHAFRRAPHYLLDARLLEAWAKALHETGDDERARYLARRLSEFHNEQSEGFFAPCAEPATTGATRPFQCQTPARPLDFEDFR